MRDIFKVFAGFTDRSSRRGRQIYNLVNTQEPPIDPNNPYSNSTTAAIGANTKEPNPTSESLSASAVIDRILFRGKLSQEENKNKCKYSCQ